VELGETLAEAATREAREECQVEVETGELLSAVDLILRDERGRVRYHYVLIDLAARYVSGEPVAATDALDVRWVCEAELADLDIVPRLLSVLRRTLQPTGTPNS
jgi:ADP-ribose pyrophosphatase YjhB (NUDIX family)